MTSFLDPRFLISLIVLGIFGWAFASNVGDDTMKGAIIGALNVVAGYWLGSSNSSNQVREQMGKALDIAVANNPTTAGAAGGAQAAADAAQDVAEDLKP